MQLDAEYEVLELYAYPGGRIDLRLVAGESETPALFDSSMFMTSDGALPANWEGRIEEGGVLRIGPREWMELGFWDAYFNQNPAAIEAYKRGRSRR